MNTNIPTPAPQRNNVLTPREFNKSIIAEVSALRGVSVDDIMSRKIDAKTSHARQQCYLELRNRGVRCGGQMSSLYIARIFGRDHTTVLHGIRRASE